MVFSGIVEEIGVVEALFESHDLLLWDGSMGKGWTLRVQAKTVLEGTYVGASISVNGVCLTVTTFDGSIFTAGLAPETYVYGRYHI
jgi:riboflavin synthase